MKIGDNVYVHGYVDEIRKGTVIIRNEGGYFGTVPSEIVDVVDEQSKVETIPVEWLKKFVNERAANDGPDGYWHYWGIDVLQMIAQWERENGHI